MMKCVNTIENFPNVIRSIKYMETLGSLAIACDKTVKIWKINMEDTYIELPHNAEVLDLFTINDKY